MEVYHLDFSIRSTRESDADITPDQTAAAAGKTMSEIRALNHEGKSLGRPYVDTLLYLCER